MPTFATVHCGKASRWPMRRAGSGKLLGSGLYGQQVHGSCDDHGRRGAAEPPRGASAGTTAGVTAGMPPGAKAAAASCAAAVGRGARFRPAAGSRQSARLRPDSDAHTAGGPRGRHGQTGPAESDQNRGQGRIRPGLPAYTDRLARSGPGRSAGGDEGELPFTSVCVRCQGLPSSQVRFGAGQSILCLRSPMVSCGVFRSGGRRH